MGHFSIWKILVFVGIAIGLLLFRNPEASGEFVLTDLVKSLLDGFGGDQTAPATNVAVTSDRIGTDVDAGGNLQGEGSFFDSAANQIAIRADYQGAAIGQTHLTASLLSAAGGVVSSGCDAVAQSVSGSYSCRFAVSNLSAGQYYAVVYADGAEKIRNTFQVNAPVPAASAPVQPDPSDATPAATGDDTITADSTTTDDPAPTPDNTDNAASGASSEVDRSDSSRAAAIFPGLRTQGGGSPVQPTWNRNAYGQNGSPPAYARPQAPGYPQYAWRPGFQRPLPARPSYAPMRFQGGRGSRR